MSISNSELTNNSAGYSGGEISVYSGSVSISNTNITNNMASLNISQSNVTFTGMNIVSNNGRPIYAFNSRIEFNGPTTLSNNHGMFGGAISSDQSQIYINTEGVIITNNTATSGGGIFLRESTLFVNEPIKIYHNTAQDGGGIYAYSSRVEFQSVQMKNAFGNLLPPNKQSELAHNIAENGGGIHAISSTIKLTQSYVNIDSNTANTSGGGVYLQKSSKLYLFKTVEVYQYYRTQDRYVKLMINNNLAQYGGGIFVADDTQRSACGGRVTENVATHSIFAGCFIQTIKLYELGYSDLNYFNTFMTNNTATQSGADIYGGLLDRCTISQSAEYHISSNGSI
ncbi:probable outer membrane protein pmp6 [Halichondria panicea]|uniref:probable outer membrane protein pmp6 n=1 Tax=Halichondria panicea TaxID=6063 RepID=UPI00312B591D